MFIGSARVWSRLELAMAPKADNATLGAMEIVRSKLIEAGHEVGPVEPANIFARSYIHEIDGRRINIEANLQLRHRSGRGSLASRAADYTNKVRIRLSGWIGDSEWFQQRKDGGFDYGRLITSVERILAQDRAAETKRRRLDELRDRLRKAAKPACVDEVAPVDPDTVRIVIEAPIDEALKLLEEIRRWEMSPKGDEP